MKWQRLHEGRDGLCADAHCLEFAAVVAPDGSRLCWGHGCAAKMRELKADIANFKQWEAELDQ